MRGAHGLVLLLAVVLALAAGCGRPAADEPIADGPADPAPAGSGDQEATGGSDSPPDDAPVTPSPAPERVVDEVTVEAVGLSRTETRLSGTLRVRASDAGAWVAVEPVRMPRAERRDEGTRLVYLTVSTEHGPDGFSDPRLAETSPQDAVPAVWVSAGEAAEIETDLTVQGQQIAPRMQVCLQVRQPADPSDERYATGDELSLRPIGDGAGETLLACSDWTDVAGAPA